jgi:hypothetical protein
MYTYSIIVLCIIVIVIVIVSVTCNNIEGLTTINDNNNSPAPIQSTTYSQIPTSSPLAQSLNNASTNTQFYTANNINYKLLDTKINFAERNNDMLNALYDNLKFTIGSVSTSGSSADKPSCIIGGNYPTNIELNFKLLPPKPGNAGKTGEQGDQGTTGIQGNKGVRGPIGGNSYS